MIRVVAKIKAKDEESLKLIESHIEQMFSHVPVQVGNWWMYKQIPVEFIEEK